MKFWEYHSEELRKARLLQAAAILRARMTEQYVTGGYFTELAVDQALALEEELTKKLSKEKK